MTIITTRTDPAARLRLDALAKEGARLRAEQEHALAFDARQEARDLKAEQRARDAGHTYSVCSCCGTPRILGWIGGACNEFDASTDDQMCPGTYRAAGGL